MGRPRKSKQPGQEPNLDYDRGPSPEELRSIEAEFNGEEETDLTSLIEDERTSKRLQFSRFCATTERVNRFEERMKLVASSSGITAGTRPSAKQRSEKLLPEPHCSLSQYKGDITVDTMFLWTIFCKKGSWGLRKRSIAIGLNGAPGRLT